MMRKNRHPDNGDHHQEGVQALKMLCRHKSLCKIDHAAPHPPHAEKHENKGAKSTPANIGQKVLSDPGDDNRPLA